ncbi:hypothetical protein F4821DRAFT_262793 [Hypoxylon rubiginosum]|uniref:Uncharacterized protein n=1 Tax=Hypoxylon rubiginosum TaxID=110542 RepID=A0ACC0CTD5_9PEZI|nr:hypothetical protein F4821DRAFT_262793 [Hypoxylon rubiginosum]
MLTLGLLRKAHRTPLRFDTLGLRNVTARELRLRQNVHLSGLRFESTTPKPKPSTEAVSQLPPPKFAFPERICVYHAGTGRITFLACLKISTLFIFVFFGFVVTPAYYEKEGLSPTVLRTTLSAIVPLVFVAYTTSPFVSFIHMRIPPFARQSEDMLRRFVRTLPPTTELDVTSMSFIAKPRASKVKLEDLYRVNRRLGIVNLARDTKAENAARRWYMFRAVGNFSAQPSSNTVTRASWVWESIMNTIKTRQV